MSDEATSPAPSSPSKRSARSGTAVRRSRPGRSRSKKARPDKAQPDSGHPDKQDDPLAIAHEEQEMCEHVVTHLNENRGPRLLASRMVDDQALISLRDQIADSHLEDVPALVAQMERVSAVASRRSQPPGEAVDPKTPYFGHLRLREEGRGVRDVLIGKGTYIEPRAGIRIVDWRHAPVSQLFYRYDEGAEYEEEFGEREVHGEVLVRRTVTIVDGELRRVSCPQGAFIRQDDGWRQLSTASSTLEGGEGAAVRASHMRGVLGAVGGIEQRADRHLPEIAALLDARQFELISKPDTGLVVIQGGAGSGKTTIGVHRMAYLTFQSRQRFAPENMLVVVGTPALREYIGQLLSALGMRGVHVVTFGDWAERARKRAFAWLRPRREDNTPVEVARLKTDPAVLRLLTRRAKQLVKAHRTSAQDALWLWADVLTDKKALQRAIAQEARRTGTPPRLSPEQIERAWRYCADRCPAVIEMASAEEEQPSYEAVEGADGLVEARDERATLDLEDDALLLRAYQLVRGPLRHKKKPLRYEHLFVDEAQDLAAVDVCVLAAITSARKSITLAGDTAQRLNVDTGFTDWSEVLDNLDLEHVKVEPLRIAYRSTRQVLQVARHVLGPLAPEQEPVAPRSGAPVEHHHMPTSGAAAAFLGEALRALLRREPRASVAVLARYPEQAEAYYNALRMAEVPHLRYVRDFDFAFRPGVEVTEIRQVKGLEYDYVILVDVNAQSYPETDEARYQLHVGATRAAHQLWVISTGAPSPLIPDWLEGR